MKEKICKTCRNHPYILIAAFLVLHIAHMTSAEWNWKTLNGVTGCCFLNAYSTAKSRNNRTSSASSRMSGTKQASAKTPPHSEPQCDFISLKSLWS